MLNRIPNGSLTTVEGDIVGGVIVGPTVEGYSMFALVMLFDNIPTGSWLGPGGVILGTPLSGPSRPLSFRDRLAAAAVEAS
jgi:hypothetical protein